MTEQLFHFSEFDAAAAGEALSAKPRPMRDIAHGVGEALDLGDTVLEVYRDAGFARITTSNARIEVYRVPSYTVGGGRVVFDQSDQDDRTRLLVRSDGKVSFYPVLRGTQRPTTSESPAAGGTDTTSAEASSEGSTASPAPSETGETEPVQLTGRLGRDPWFNTHEDTPTAGFPLAVNDERGTTTWHRVVVQGELAQHLQQGARTGEYKKGRLVNITGQQVVRTEPTERGGTRTTREIHATVVTRMTTTRARPTP